MRSLKETSSEQSESSSLSVEEKALLSARWSPESVSYVQLDESTSKQTLLDKLKTSDESSPVKRSRLVSETFGPRERRFSARAELTPQEKQRDLEQLFGAESPFEQYDEQASKSDLRKKRVTTVALKLLRTVAIICTILLVIYFWPIEGPLIEPKIAPHRPRPKFQNQLAINELLDEAGERLFTGQFHAPESMAWRADKRAFYTGVEGGFILLVEPYEERWTVAARLNARNLVYDHTSGRRTESADPNSTERKKVEFCERDVELYGKRAEFEPALVQISRCSRPLGIRLSPDDSYLYVNDPLSGLYKIELEIETKRAREVSKLIDLARFQQPDIPGSLGQERVLFGDDIAVDWGAGSEGSDVIYMTDCSQRWSLRYLIRLMLEYDDSGRVLVFDTGERLLRPLGHLKAEITHEDGHGNELHELDERNLSFPNGVELTANRSALLVSDLNNRRILMHHLKGPRAGTTEHLLWVAGYSDNIRRGLDLADGQPTYWAACGCAVSDGRFEIAELMNELPKIRKLFLKLLHLVGAGLESLGELLSSSSVQDLGLMIKSAWLKHDPYCTHGLVFQFTEQGQVLRSLHGPHFSSHFKLLSEAHQVPIVGRAGHSALYLGSVYYPYLGRVELVE